MKFRICVHPGKCNAPNGSIQFPPFPTKVLRGASGPRLTLEVLSAVFTRSCALAPFRHYFRFTPGHEWCRLGDRFKAFEAYFDSNDHAVQPFESGASGARAVDVMDGVFALKGCIIGTKRAQAEDSEGKAEDEIVVTASSEAS